MTDTSSLFGNSRALGKLGVTLVLVSGAILWVVFSRSPAPPPESLSELERVVVTVESVSEDFRPLYTTKIGRRAVVHERSLQGLVLALKTDAGERAQWAIERWLIDEPEDVPRLRDALRPGTRVTAYARDGLVYQLEGPQGVLVDAKRAGARRGIASVAALALVGLALVVGVAACVRAGMQWSRQGDDASP